jgi:putative ABC transport system permease protein
MAVSRALNSGARAATARQVPGASAYARKTAPPAVGYDLATHSLMFTDLKLAWKRLRNSPGFAVIAIVTLALAVGANTAIFTVADAVLFRPLPYEDPDRLFVVRMLDQATGERWSGVPYEYVASVQRHHSGVAEVALRSTTMMLDHAGAVGGESVETFYAAPDYLKVLGAPLARGRHFDTADALASAGHRVVLTYESWQRRFGGDETILGRGVRLGSIDRTVVGILAPAFIFPSASLLFSDITTGRAEFTMVAAPPDPDDPTRRSSVTLGGMAVDAVLRLKPGVSATQARAELDVLSARVRASRPMDATHVVVLEDVRSVLFPTGRRVIVLLLASAALVLLIGCANLANLLIARTRRRERDIALQTAFGARPIHVVRQIAFEALMIGSAAGALALFATYTFSDLLLREVPPMAYGRAFVKVDVRVAIFCCAVALLSSLLFAIVPAFRGARSNVLTLLRRGATRGRRRRVFGQPMIVLQVALTLVLSVGGFTAAREFRAVANQPLGFASSNLIVVSVRPQFEEHVLRSFFARVVKSLRQHGDVLAAGAGSSRPFDRGGAADSLGEARQDVWVGHVLPGYLEALGVHLSDGTLPHVGESPTGLEPVVVTKSAAAKLFPGRRAIGAPLPLEDRTAEVVAVIDDIRTDFEERPSWIFVVPRASTRFRALVVRTRARRADILADVRRQVVTLTPPDEPVIAKWLDESIGAHAAYRTPRFQTVILGGFSSVALSLVALGVFAAVAAIVASRAREMGIRTAIGASPSALVRLIVREMAFPILTGVALGIGATQIAHRVAQAYVPELAAPYIGAVGLAVIVVCSAGLIAAYLPARRATRVDPIVVLRAE